VPGSQLEREHDVSVVAVGAEHEVCPKDVWLASLSTVVEVSGARARSHWPARSLARSLSPASLVF
jgi:RAB protein geranylgeranyltransferase component A